MGYLEWGRIILDFLKALLWPGALLAICWYFRDDLKSMAARVVEAGMSRLVFTPLPTSPQSIPTQTLTIAANPQAESQSSASEAALSGNQANTENVNKHHSALLAENIARIRAVVSPEELDPQIANTKSEMPADIRNDPSAAIDLLLYAASALSIQLAHERTYRSIFGSQIGALVRMNIAGGAERISLQEIYDNAAAAFPNMYPQQLAFDHWLGFLTASDLARLDTDGKYQSTAKGRGFLRYMLDNRLADKPF